MDEATRPLGGVFCVECGPGTKLDPDLESHQLLCPRCGAVEPLPGKPLFVVTGASGAGKSTVLELVRRRLPDFETFDSDLIWHVDKLGPGIWLNTWLQLAYTISRNGRATVLFGALGPDWFERLSGRRLVGAIHFCHLNCADPLLEERLRARPAWRESSSEEFIARQKTFAAWLRGNVHPTFDTGLSSADEVAECVAEWIQSLAGDDRESDTGFLAGVAPG